MLPGGLICAFYHVKISDTHTIKKRWLRDLFGHVHSFMQSGGPQNHRKISGKYIATKR